MRLNPLLWLLVACGSGPPSWPEGAGLEIDDTTAERLAFRWPAAEGGEVAGYVVRVNGEDAARLDPGQTRYDLAGLAEARDHRLEVVAVGPDGSESLALVARERTLDGTAPFFEMDEEQSHLDPIEVRVEEDGVHLSWASASDAVGVAGYRVRKDGEEVGSVEAPETTLVLAGATWDAPAELEVVALDEAGNISEPGLRMRWAPSEPEGPRAEVAQENARRGQLDVRDRVRARLVPRIVGAPRDHLLDLVRDGEGANPSDEALAPVSPRERGRGAAGTSAGTTREPPRPRGRITMTIVTRDLSRPRAEQALRARLGSVRRCNEWALRGEAFAGRFAATLIVAPEGRVTFVEVTAPLRPSFDRCARNELLDMRLSQGEPSTLGVEYRLAPAAE